MTNPFKKLAEAGGDEPVVRVEVPCRCSGTGWWEYDVILGSTTTCAETDPGAIRCECKGVQYRTLRVPCSQCQGEYSLFSQENCGECQGRGWICLECGEAAWITYLWYIQAWDALPPEIMAEFPFIFDNEAALIEAAEKLIEEISK